MNLTIYRGRNAAHTSNYTLVILTVIIHSLAVKFSLVYQESQFNDTLASVEIIFDACMRYVCVVRV